MAITNHRFVATLLKSDTLYLNDLIRSLAESSEVLTKGNIELEDRDDLGTIKNWISFVVRNSRSKFVPGSNCFRDNNEK